MYRVIVIACAGVFLSACGSTPDWMKVNWDSLKPAPATETVRFESEPPGAEAKTSTGQTCRTPCALAMPATGSFNVTFALNGYQPESEKVEYIQMGDGTGQLRPNPVLVELMPAPVIQQKPKQPVAPKKKSKPVAARTQRQPSNAATGAASEPQQQQSAPWPAAR